MNKSVRRADCFGCWTKIENPALLFSPGEEVSSDNVVTRTATELCPKCWNEVFEFIMGKESPNYETGRPTLQEALTTKRRERLAGDNHG